jgi:hypothetical protein
MRFHLLSSVATGGLNSRSEIRDFFSSTYLGHSQTNSYLQENIDSMLRWLVEKRFIRRTNIGENHESWDDETPSWVDAAQSASGVSQKSRLRRHLVSKEHLELKSQLRFRLMLKHWIHAMKQLRWVREWLNCTSTLFLQTS